MAGGDTYSFHILYVHAEWWGGLKQVNNTLIAYIYQRVYIRLPRRYLFVGHVNRHWGAFAKRCINNRMIRHDAKGVVPIVYCLRKMHLWGSKLHAGYSIPLRFYLGWSAFGGRCQKIRVRPYYII